MTLFFPMHLEVVLMLSEALWHPMHIFHVQLALFCRASLSLSHSPLCTQILAFYSMFPRRSLSLLLTVAFIYLFFLNLCHIISFPTPFGEGNISFFSVLAISWILHVYAGMSVLSAKTYSSQTQIFYFQH